MPENEKTEPHWIVKHAVEVVLGVVLTGALALFAAFGKDLSNGLNDQHTNEREALHLKDIRSAYNSHPTELSRALSKARNEGLDLNTMADGAVTHLFAEALMSSDEGKVGSFLQAELSATAPVSGETGQERVPLTLALANSNCRGIQASRRSIIRALVASGAKGSAEYQEAGETRTSSKTHPLLMLSMSDCFDTTIADILLESGANVNETQFDEYGLRTPLSASVRAENIDTVVYLLERGADPNIEGALNQTPLYTHMQYFSRSDLRPSSMTRGCEPKPKFVLIAEVLLKFGADPNILPDNGTPISDIISAKLDRGQCQGDVCYAIDDERVRMSHVDWCLEYLMTIFDPAN